MKYFAPKLFINQHRVLEKIYNVPSVRDFPNVRELTMSLGLSEDEIMQAAYLLKGRGFANVSRDKQPFVISCTPNGGQAFLQQAILDEGRERFKANLLRWMQVGGILVASIISIGTFAINTLSTINNSKNIEALKAEVISLKRDAEIRKLKTGNKSRSTDKSQFIK